MPIDQKDKDKLIKFWDEKIPDMGVCPLCKKSQWSVSDTLWEVREFFQGGLKVGSPVYPVIIVTCNNCGNTYFLNAIVAGIVKPEQKGGKDD